MNKEKARQLKIAGDNESNNKTNKIFWESPINPIMGEK